jgi:hypothetical protein
MHWLFGGAAVRIQSLGDHGCAGSAHRQAVIKMQRFGQIIYDHVIGLLCRYPSPRVRAPPAHPTYAGGTSAPRMSFIPQIPAMLIQEPPAFDPIGNFSALIVRQGFIPDGDQNAHAIKTLSELPWLDGCVTEPRVFQDLMDVIWISDRVRAIDVRLGKDANAQRPVV